MDCTHLPRSLACGSALAATLLSSGCALTETAIVPSVDVVIVESFVEWQADFNRGRALVFLHRSVDGPRGRAEPVDGAIVTLTLPDGTVVPVPQVPRSACVATRPVEGTGSCYLLGPNSDPLPPVAPGDRVDLRIETRTGEILTSSTTLPGLHRMRVPRNSQTCVLPPDTPLELVWTQADGVWAYQVEALLWELGAALAPRGIEVEEEPLPLVGLSISAADTTLVFPAQLGIFDRADLDQDLALALQEGLPAGVDAQVSVGGADRNLVNWLRGGGFNPSGPVRVPSVQGDGTGFFGSAVLRTFSVRVPREGQFIDASDCLPRAAGVS